MTLQARLANQSPIVWRIVVPDTAMSSHQERPDVVVAAIREVLAAA